MMREFSTTAKDLIKVIDEAKLAVLKELYGCDEKKRLCGSNLCDKLDISKNLLSYHIKSLRELKLVDEKKVGRNKYYFVPNKKKAQVQKLLEAFDLI